MISNLFAIDYQVHSLRSHDGTTPLADMCSAAIAHGIDEIGFTEHKDFNPADPVVEYFEYERYREEIEAARKQFTGQIVVRMGVEIDYQYWFEEKVRTYLDAHEFDYVIGAVHYVEGMTVMSAEYTATRDVVTAYRQYYEEVERSVQSGLFNVLAHLEYANRRGVPAYGAFDPAPYRDQVSRIFDIMIEQGIALEINTAGIRQGAGVTYPCEQHVQLYADRGGKLLTIGSDAHRPEDLAADYSAAVDIALRAGLNQVTTYNQFVPTQKDLLLQNR